MCGDVLAKIQIDGSGLTITQNLVFDPDRHGNPRYYFRRKGQKKIRLRAQPGSQAFLDEFQAALTQACAPTPADACRDTAARLNPPRGSLAWLFNEYERRAQSWKGLGETTQKRRRVVMDQICDETASEADLSKIGLKPFASMRPRAVEVICQRCATPATQNARLKAFREAFKFAIKEDWMTANPGREVAYSGSNSGGYHTWTVEEVAMYESRWPVGSVKRLALGMLMFTGARRSDAVVIGKQHCKTVERVPGWQFRQFKGRDKSPVTTWIPILADLQAMIDVTQSRGMAYLETSFHKPFTAKGFGTQFKKWCRLAGLPHCSAHGLRKAAATVAAERGATAHQLMAIFGWRSISQALVYTKAAEQKRLAAAAMYMLAQCPTDSPAVSHQKYYGGKSDA